MKRKYKILRDYDIKREIDVYDVTMRWGFIDIPIKRFMDKDSSFARREAEELLAKLNE